eukprot:CAMPEP_0185292352 /NCGR_PEP_ID=MMETSP1363-20130426/6010_1 /TAXON_ID=38817 /ORGANISM="Gephyrocapsa oceanica, Strain RCC1303" /LENGTH=111 /DNA_ID=CAMNT_0027888591 /DNA_START=130 /DNA_END=461 /DNA_ORIENTATION=-
MISRIAAEYSVNARSAIAQRQGRDELAAANSSIYRCPGTAADPSRLSEVACRWGQVRVSSISCLATRSIAVPHPHKQLFVIRIVDGQPREEALRLAQQPPVREQHILRLLA